MHTDGRATATVTGYAGRVGTKPPEWHGLVVWDVLLNNLATGLYMAAAAGEFALPGLLAPLAKVAYVVALVLLLADLVCLVLDLGDPLRFHHMLRVFKLSSPMSFGVWALSAFSFALTGVVGLVFFGLYEPECATLEWGRRLLVVVGLPLALASSVYKGVLFSTTAQPGWKDGRWLGAYLTTASVMLGCAELLLVSLFMGPERATDVLRQSLALLVAVNAVVLAVFAAELRPALRRLSDLGQFRRLGALAVVGGTAVPLGVLLLTGRPEFVAGAVLLLVAGSFGLRYLLVMLPHWVA